MILDTTHAIGWKANDFALQGIDGKRRYLANDCQAEWAAGARRSLKFCETQARLRASA
jgi:hypothetical protein